jgi:DNA-directed RNA polymerase specialized sigma24 family protein
LHITPIESDVVDPRADDRERARIGGALEELDAVDASLAQLVDLKFFCGFTFAEIAAMRGVTERTVQRHWEKARIYLHQSLRDVELA